MPEKFSPARSEQSQPTPLEELSTMVMPGWREELALLRKEQEQAQADAAPSTPSGKPAERPAQEPPSQRIYGKPLAPRETPDQGTPTLQKDAHSRPEQRKQEPRTDTRSAGLYGRPQDTPLPSLNDRARRAPHALTPIPPQGSSSQAGSAPRELPAKSGEQELTLHYPQTRPEELETGPAPAIEQNPLASVSFGQDDLVEQISEVETVHWQMPISPFPAAPGDLPAGKEQRPPLEDKPSPQPETADRPPIKAESRQEVREKDQQPNAEKAAEDEIEVEDLPTVPLAVPEAAQPRSQITIERTSTPAPKNWGNTQANQVEDQPTRPMAASSGPAAPRSPQPPAAQKAPNPPSAPGIPGPGAGLSSRSVAQASEIAIDPQISRGRPMSPPAQPGQRFDPTSLPPLPQTPLSTPGNTRLGPGTQRPQQHPPSPFPETPGQRPPAFTPLVAPRPGEAGATPEEPRKKRHVGRILAIALIVLVVLGAGSFFYIYQTTAAPPITQPYQSFQNSAFGVSLSYPQGWKANVNQAHSVVLFTDSSHTNQINLSLATASGQLSDYLSQQNKQWGIASPKAAPAVTFAGSNWQQEQGSVTQQGATYTIELYVTQHNTHFYALAFLAPAKSFAQEQNDFAHVRSTFSFI